jgi:hypothetical protein
MIKPAVGAIILCLITLMVCVPTRLHADIRCQQLEALHAQYAGVELTSTQKELKRQLVAWYYAHCRERHVAGKD